MKGLSLGCLILILLTSLVSCSQNAKDQNLHEVPNKATETGFESDTVVIDTVVMDGYRPVFDYSKIEFDTVFSNPIFEQTSKEAITRKVLSKVGSLEAYAPGNDFKRQYPELFNERIPENYHQNGCDFCAKKDQENKGDFETILDAISKPFKHYPVNSNTIEAVDGVVYFDTKDFAGHNVPFEGYVEGNIKQIWLDGKKVKFENNKDLFFRQTLDLYIGYNKFPVRIVGKSGKETTDWIVINMVSRD